MLLFSRLPADNSTLKCPEFPDHVMAGEAIEGLNCSISKFGTVIHSWLNNAEKAEALNLDFTVVDAEGVSDLVRDTVRCCA